MMLRFLLWSQWSILSRHLLIFLISSEVTCKFNDISSSYIHEKGEKSYNIIKEIEIFNNWWLITDSHRDHLFRVLFTGLTLLDGFRLNGIINVKSHQKVMESGYLSLITWDIHILGSVVCRGLFSEVVDALVRLRSGIYGNKWFFGKKNAVYIPTTTGL